MGAASRIVGWIVLGMIAYVAVGGAMSAVAGNPKPRGQLYDIGGGRMLHMVCAGPARGDGPTVLFEAGAFGFSADWGVVQARLAAQGVRSCAYDRAGLGFSDPGPAPRDGLAIVGDLESLLAASGERGPFILCGHSMAGLHLRLFAARNPDKVAGIVLVDATTPEAMDVKLVRQFVGQFANLSRLAAWGAQGGLFKPLTGTSLADKIGLEGAAQAEKRWAFASGRHNAWAAEEVRQWPLTATEAREAGAFNPDWPVAVITAGAPNGRAGWKDTQTAPARASRHGFIEHVDGAGHATLLGVGFADQVVRGINHVRGAIASQAAPVGL
jgi:pimeloyl-ACP methyl ester carboxylesterase